MQLIVEYGAKAIGAESSVINIREGRNWIVKFVYNFPNNIVGQIKSDKESPTSVYVANKKETIAFNDAPNDSRVNQNGMKLHGVASLMVAPIILKDEISGIIAFYHHKKQVIFTEAQIDFTNKLASSLSQALENAQLLEEKQSLLNAVQAERDKLSALVNSIPDEVWFADTNKQVTLANPAAVKEFGFSEGIEVERMAAESEVYRSDGSPRPVEEAPPLRALKGEFVKNQEEIVRTPATKQLRYRQVNASPVKDAEDNIIGSVSVVRDITERKKAEEKLIDALNESQRLNEELESSNEELQSTTEELQISNEELRVTTEELAEKQNILNSERELLQAIIDSIPVMIAIYEPQIEVLRINKEIEKVTGWKQEDMEHIDLMEELYPDPDYRKEVEEYMQSLTSGWKEITMIARDGLKIDSVWANVKLTGGGNVGIGLDISERKKAEEALKESENLYKTLFENTNDAFQLVEPIYDKTGKAVNIRILEVNDAYESQVGIKASAVEGRLATEIDPNLEKNWIEIHGAVAKTGNSKRTEIYNNYTKRWYELYLFPYGKGLVGVLFRDITERKKAKEHLQEIVEELERSNRELQSFAYITSHDLQEPLRTIASFTQLLERRYYGKLDADANEFMDYIVEAAKRMKDMIQGLLEYSRVDTQAEQFKEFKSEQAVKLALNHLHSSIAESNAEITFDNLPNIIGDEHQIVRVFQNLISNALKFKKEDVKPEIRISSYKTKDGKGYVFSIADNGIGMEEVYSDKIFEPFKRLHTIDAYEGTGIGLAVVKRIIEHHGGRIWFESEFGVGSTFYFTIPIKE